MENKNNETRKSEKPLYKKKSLWIGIILILAVAAGGAYWFIGNLNSIYTDDAFIEGDKLNVSSKILGRVVKLYVAERDTVHEGQLIAELDSTDLVAKLNQTKAIYNNSVVNVELAKVNLDKATIDYNRTLSQYTDKVTPKIELDNATKKLDAANVEYKIAKSKVESAISDMELQKTNLLNTKLYSTINGVVAKKWIYEGDVLQPSQPIYTIYNLGNIWVTAQLEETKLNNINIGNVVEISVDAYPDIKFSGKVYQIGVNTAAQFSLIPPSNASGNFTKVTQRIPIKISINALNSNNKIKYGLLPGMSVEVNIKGNHNG